MPACWWLCTPQGSVGRTSEGAALDLGLGQHCMVAPGARTSPDCSPPLPRPRGLRQPRLKTHRHAGIEILLSAISIKESRPSVWIGTTSQQCWAQGWTIRYVPSSALWGALHCSSCSRSSFFPIPMEVVTLVLSGVSAVLWPLLV